MQLNSGVMAGLFLHDRRRRRSHLVIAVPTRGQQRYSLTAPLFFPVTHKRTHTHIHPDTANVFTDSLPQRVPSCLVSSPAEMDVRADRQEDWQLFTDRRQATLSSGRNQRAVKTQVVRQPLNCGPHPPHPPHYVSWMTGVCEVKLLNNNQYDPQTPSLYANIPSLARIPAAIGVRKCHSR